jgi:hypothetical protein
MSEPIMSKPIMSKPIMSKPIHEINYEHYENIITKKSRYYGDTVKVLEIVKKFLVREQRILVGGMAIDMALKLKDPNSGIYGDDILPDYDFYSATHFKDAYNLAEWLYRTGFRNISVINGLHPSTMRVRVNFIDAADITYVPKSILDHIPTLKYKGFNIIHPHPQMIDQHRALSYPYENAPWETIMGKRPKNDMKRYDLLYGQYPLRLLNIKDRTLETRQYSFQLEVFEGQCISGFFALNYWLETAKELGFDTSYDFGGYSAKGDMLDYTIPLDSHGITIYSDNIEELHKMIMNVYKFKKRNTETRFYNRFLDKLPRKIIIDNEFELMDNNQKIAAHEVDLGKKIHVANLQTVMMYLMVNYILLMKIKNIKRGYSFYVGYLECRNLIGWASKKYYGTTNANLKAKLVRFFPTHEVYGARNLSESYIVAKHKFDVKNRMIRPDEGPTYAQPSHVYDRDLTRMSAPKKYFDFDVKSSEVFDFDGGQTQPFFNLKN